MQKSIVVNKEVDLMSVYFKGGAHMKSYPKRIECEGQAYNFTEGLEMLVKKGNEAFKLFFMTDGTANYRLRHDMSAHSWTLECITQN